MGTMNPIEKMEQRIKNSFPKAHCAMDAAETPTGSWFLDIGVDNYSMIIEWRPDRGFGLTAGRECVFGEGADETYPDYGSAVRRVLWLVEHQMKTAPALSD